MIDIFEKLSAPFQPEAVSWRVGKVKRDGSGAMALAYIDARDVMDRLDEVCGPGGWQNRYSHANGKTVCDIAIKIDGEWIWKADGAGDSDIEAEKGALSDAFKRGAVRWGVGRYLYAIPSPWVKIDQYKQIIAEEQAKLEDLLKSYTTEFEWGSPESRATLRVLLNTIKNTVKTHDDIRRWREENQGVFAQMRVKAKEQVEKTLAQIAEQADAVADDFRQPANGGLSGRGSDRQVA